MAPINRYDHDALEQQLKDTIQSLYQILVQVSAYDTSGSTPRSPAPGSSAAGTPYNNPAAAAAGGSTPGPAAGSATASREVLANEFSALSNSLRAINATTAMNTNNPSSTASQLPMIPPELIQYVENGRNPDIYTREFVELVRRGNQLIKGKRVAFAGFRDVLAAEMRGAMPELAGDVERVLNGGVAPGAAEVKKEEGGAGAPGA